MIALASNELGQIVLNSPAELADAAESARSHMHENSSWTGETIAQALEFTRRGNPARVAEAESMIEKIVSELELEAPEWANDVAGAYPDVPAYLSGQPECMRRRILSVSEKSPVRVWVDVTSSAGIKHEMLAKRGTAALALVMSLIREGRAVELYTYTSLGGRKNGQSVVAVRMLTAPIDTASVAHCLTSQGYARTLCYGVSHSLGGNGGWSNHGQEHRPFPERLKAHQTKVLESLYSPGDVVIPPCHFDDPAIKNPIQWVNDRLAETRASIE